MQVRCRVLDIIVLVLAGAAFCGEQATAVDVFEIPIGKFVMSLGVRRFFVIDSQIPFAVFGKTVEAEMNSFSCCADGWCSLHASRSSYTNLPSLISPLACSNARRLSVTAMVCSPVRVVRFAEGGNS
jgi:hypothetical protein